MVRPALVDSTVKVTIRQSETALNASVATTASINREEATGMLWPLKPAARGDRLMVEDPLLVARANHPRAAKRFAAAAGNIGAIRPPIRRKR